MAPRLRSTGSSTAKPRVASSARKRNVSRGHRPRATKYLWVLGGACAVAGWLLYFRMAIELNRVLPPRDRIPMIEIGHHFHDVKRLHEKWFPKSRLRLASFALIGTSTALVAAGILVEITR